MKIIIMLFAVLLSATTLSAQKMEKTKVTGKVVILLAHPNFKESQANKALIDAVKDMPGVVILDLYAEPFDAEAHKKILSEAKAVVFQFPFYWASAPSQLKKWLDEIFTPLAQTEVVKDKPLMVVTTTGSEYEAYRSGGRNHFTMDELLRPYQLVANHSGMAWQTPHVVYGAATPAAAENLKEGTKIYRQRIEALLKK